MTRHGATLVELLVALCVGSVVIALCANSMIAQRRAEGAIASADAGVSSADEAVRVLASVLRRVAAADSLIARGDTALEWRATIGTVVACAAGADTAVVPDTGAGAWWESVPDSGDAVDVGHSSGEWTHASIVAVRAQASGGACGVAQHTLHVRPLAALDGLSGVPVVRVTRRTRFMLYRGGDGAWWLGERTCADITPFRCDAAQPIAGPLASPPRGLRFTLDTVSTPHTVGIRVIAGRIVRDVTIAIVR